MLGIISKQCAECKAFKPIFDFHKRKRSRDGLVVYCKPCACARTRRWAQNNPERVKETQDKLYKKNRQKRLDDWRIHRYGVTPEMRAEMLEKQDHKCAICEVDEPQGRGDWHVDHDHETGAVRAFLCSSCNVGLGKFKDSVELLLKAAAYLKYHK